MSKLKGSIKGHNFHGAVDRFEVVAEYIVDNFGRNIKYIADVAGGQGMLTRILRKQYNYEAEVVDPRGNTLVGVPSNPVVFSKEMADNYDLIIGLHPDEATRSVAEAALFRPTLLIPCCNFWNPRIKLDRNGLITEISKYYDSMNISYKIVEFGFKSYMNKGLVSTPPNSLI
jgi:hypothetical protein